MGFASENTHLGGLPKSLSQNYFTLWIGELEGKPEYKRNKYKNEINFTVPINLGQYFYLSLTN